MVTALGLDGGSGAGTATGAAAVALGAEAASLRRSYFTVMAAFPGGSATNVLPGRNFTGAPALSV